MHLGLANRAVASTSMNAVSSRSHCIINLYIVRRWHDSNDVQHSKLCLVISILKHFEMSLCCEM